MCDFKDSCKEYDSEPCDIVTRQPPSCFKPLQSKTGSSIREKTCILCKTRETCGVVRPIVAFLKGHSATRGKDYDDLYAWLPYTCNIFIPLPGGGEGTTEYNEERHLAGDCVEDCPLCENERD